MSTHRDPVCGMAVDSETAAATLTDEGHSYYFCSTACRDRFAADPAAFRAAGRPTEMERHEPPHTTTGSWTSPKFGSAGSGGLEFEPLPEAHDEEERR